MGWDTGAASLPASHLFLTAAFGRCQKTVAVPRWASLLGAVTLVLGAVWSLGCTVYVVGHDGLLAAAMRRERDMQYDYEDRITALQRQLDRSVSQQVQLERTVGTRLESLTAQQDDLRRKAGTVASLAEAVQRLAPPGLAFSKPVPVAGGNPAPTASDHDARREALPSERLADRLADLTRSLTVAEASQQETLGRLQIAAADQASRYRDAFGEAGLSLSRFAAADGDALGGPFVPLDAKAVASPFERAALTLRATLDEAATLKTAAGHVPFDKPLPGAPEVTSPFGARTDPFLGRPALHTGIDLRDGTGTDVAATAPGRVISAGPVSGYGLMVEIDHGAGLTTRYAHLSMAAVGAGQQVARGETIGQVGATGRATGPHLHYETRIDGEPVDPMRFLQAGQRLARGSP